ncbi:DsbE family thiol:disulfide interchange protein [Roseomonas aeriglobus]|nr:DsbE family thiol:disulfide interchange protein [Roseomonas aeriglobus]
MKRWLIWLPFIVFAGLLWLVASELLSPSERLVRSKLVDKPVPAFALDGIVADKPGLSSADFGKGEPRLLNVFASWCVPCIAEAPQLLALKRAGVRIDAIAIRDRPDAVQRFLARNGDPYATIGDDRTSRVQLALGSSGVPETFLIDGRGRIVRQHIGDIRADEVADLIAAVRAAR